MRDYLGVLWRRSWIVLGVTAIVFGVGLYRSEQQTRVYQAEGQLELANANTDAGLQTQLGIIASPAVHDAAARAKPGIGQVSAQQAGLGNIVSVSATSTDPKRAARTVNATIDAYRTYVQKQADEQAATARPRSKREFASCKPRSMPSALSNPRPEARSRHSVTP